MKSFLPATRARWGTRITACLIAACSAAMLAGCTVPTAGSTGITVDAQGRPVLVFAMCEAHIDGASIYRDRADGDPTSLDPSVSVADWDARLPITPGTSKDASLNTAQPSDLWSRVGTGEALRPGVLYSAYGWTSDNSWSAASVDFTLKRLATLKPGQVLTQAYDDAKGDFVEVVEPFAEFAARACPRFP